MLDNLMRLYSQ